MEIVIEDNIIGISFGLSGLLFLFYFIIESVFFYHTKTLMIQNFVVYNIVKYKLNKILSKRTLESNWWILKSIKVYGNGFLKYNVWVEIELIYTKETTTGWVKVDRLINFNLDNLKEQMLYYDSAVPKSKRISIKRNNILEQIGI